MAGPAQGVNNLHLGLSDQVYNHNADVIVKTTFKLSSSLTSEAIEKKLRPGDKGVITIKVPNILEASNQVEIGDLPIESARYEAIVKKLKGSIKPLPPEKAMIFENLKKLAAQKVEEGYGYTPFLFSQLENLEINQWSNSNFFQMLVHLQVQNLKV